MMIRVKGVWASVGTDNIIPLETDAQLNSLAW